MDYSNAGRRAAFLLLLLCACGKKNGAPADALFLKLEPAETGIAFSNRHSI
jgi:hypothetical protein